MKWRELQVCLRPSAGLLACLSDVISKILLIQFWGNSRELCFFLLMLISSVQCLLVYPYVTSNISDKTNQILNKLGELVQFTIAGVQLQVNDCGSDDSIVCWGKPVQSRLRFSRPFPHFPSINCLSLSRSVSLSAWHPLSYSLPFNLWWMLATCVKDELCGAQWASTAGYGR